MLLPARRGIAGLASLALLATVVVAAAPVVVQAPPVELVTIAPDQASASLAARRQGARVEVASMRSESASTFANPDGSWTLEQSVGPVRAIKGDKWVPVDRTLVGTAGGTLVPKASSAEVEFSAGGHTPLARFSHDGKELTLSWPGVLPKPEVAGDTATYVDVVPGIDLRVRATDQGFGHDIVVKTREAVLDRITLGVAVRGVRLTADKAGNLSGLDDAGTEVFHSPAPLMWDSGSPRVERRVGVEVGDGTLTLVPDAALAQDPNVLFPLMIAPTYSRSTPDASASWTLVRHAFPDIEHWNQPWRDDDERYFGVARIGHAPGYPSTYLDRSLFKFDTSQLGGAVIKEATFRIWQVWKYANTCTASAVDPMILYQTGDISAQTNWNNQPADGKSNPAGVLATSQSVPKAGEAGCPPNWVGMPAAGAVQLAVNAGAPAVVLGLQANDEDRNGVGGGWKRFYAQNSTYPMLSIVYNRAPTISDVGTDPRLSACRWCLSTFVGATTLNLRGTVADRDGGQIDAEWTINQPSSHIVTQTLAAGNVAATPFDTRPIANGATVAWRMRATDGELSSPYVVGGRFTIDRVAPARAPKVAAQLYKEDNRWHGGVGVSDSFTFTPDLVPDDPVTPADETEFNDIDHYLWGWQDPPATVAHAATALGDSATVQLTPPGDGPRTLYVRSVDRAGNPSPTKAYRFYVRAGNGPLAQWSLEGNTQDSAFLGDRHGTLEGTAAYTTGAVGNALRFQQGSVVAPAAVATDTSFSVSAWVQPDSLGQTNTVVSQSGSQASAFQLGYRADGGGRWFFAMPTADTGTAGSDVAVSTQAVTTTAWTHLTGVFDAPRGELRLYVNGEPAPAVTHVPVRFPAGQVRVGSGLANGVPANHWVGLVDEVQVYDRVVERPEITSMISGSGVQLAHWKFDEAVDTAGDPGTTARNAVDGGDMAVLRGGTKFTSVATTDGSARGVVDFDGVDGYVTTNEPTIRTDQSFSVAALVWLDPDLNSPTDAYTVVSQDGAHVCGFCLQFDKATGKWVFVAPTDDDVSPDGYNFVLSEEPAVKKAWTHLAGTYDASTDTMTLYVNGKSVGTKTGAVTFPAHGALQIGRGKAGDLVGNHFRGMIDELRVYPRAIGPDEVHGLMTATGVTAGTWRLDGDVLDSSGNELHGTLNGERVWTAGQTAIPDPADRALRLSGTGAHVSAPHTVATDLSFSVSVWARADQVGRRAVVVSQDGASRSEFVVGTTAAGRWTFAMPQGPGSAAQFDEVVGGAAQQGAWTHLVGVYSGGRIELFVNGDSVGSAPHTPVASAPGGGLQIGRAQFGGQNTDYFEGAVDDVVVYARSLPDSEIRSIAGRDLSLVHNWQLDETSGSVAADSVGTRGGTLSGGTTFNTGRVGNAAWLDGTGGDVTTTGTDLRTDQSFTVAAWVHLDKNTATNATAVSIDGTATSKFRLGYLAPDADMNPWGRWTFEMPVADDARAPARAALSTWESELDTWVHLVGVYDATSGMLWLYVNGTRQTDSVLDVPWHGTGGLRIGRAMAGGGLGQPWHGGVDDVRLYTGALDRKRVDTLYDSFPAQAEAPTLPAADAGQWSFDEATGAVATDRSGHGFDASLQGGASWVGGRNGPALWLDGTSGHAQTAGPVLETNRSFSISAWAYLTSAGADGTVVAQDDGHTSAFQLRYHAAAGRWAVLVPTEDAANPGTVLLTASEAAGLTEWTHLGMVYDAPANQVRLYVNGVLAATRHGVVIGASSGPFSIGRARWADKNASFFGRGIDDVRVFGDVLDDGEMRLLHDDVPTVVLNSWRFDDGTARDYDLRANHATTTGGATFGPGISGQALVLDGTDDAAVAAMSGVGMRDSFTVSAWARLSRGDRVATVVGQDSTWVSGFVLQYRPESGRWIFGAPTQDADGAALSYTASHQPAVLDQWVHLTGVYDRAAQRLKLYVNGQLSGTHTQGALWAATGAFTIGRGKWGGVPANFFPGAIDEVRVDQGLVSEANIARRASWPAPYKGTLGSFVNMAGDHYTAPTALPVLAGYRFERTLGMPVAADQPGTRLLYSCRIGTDMFTSIDPGCDGQVPLGEVGRVYIDPPADVSSVPIHRCVVGGDRFDSRTGCGGGTAELLGYTAAYAPLSRYFSFHFDHWTTIDGVLPGYRLEGRTGWVPLTQEPGTQPLMSCRNGVDEFTSTDPGCEGEQVLAPIGYVYGSPPSELLTAPLYRCRMGAELSTEQFTSGSEVCEGRTVDRLLGHVLLTPPVPVA